jgi:hypothetical protein
MIQGREKIDLLGLTAKFERVIVEVRLYIMILLAT